MYVLCYFVVVRWLIRLLASYIPPNPGPVVDQVSGKTLMQHAGLWTFTLGENARIPGMRERMFVSSKDQGSNTIYVVPGR